MDLHGNASDSKEVVIHVRKQDEAAAIVKLGWSSVPLKTKTVVVLKAERCGGRVQLEAAIRALVQCTSVAYQYNTVLQLLCGWNQLESFPEGLFELRRVEVLSLCANKLVSLPTEVGKLVNLVKLDLRQNQLVELPPAIGKLENLEELDLTANHLSELPPAIAKLSRLRILDLSRNRFRLVPKFLGALSALKKLAVAANPIQEPQKSLLESSDDSLSGASSRLLLHLRAEYTARREDSATLSALGLETGASFFPLANVSKKSSPGRSSTPPLSSAPVAAPAARPPPRRQEVKRINRPSARSSTPPPSYTTPFRHAVIPQDDAMPSAPPRPSRQQEADAKAEHEARMLRERFNQAQQKSDETLSLIVEADLVEIQSRVKELEKKSVGGFLSRLLNSGQRELEKSLSNARRELSRADQLELLRRNRPEVYEWYLCLVYCLNRSYLAMSAIADGTVSLSKSGVPSLAANGAKAAAESIPLIGLAIKALFALGQGILDNRKRNQAGRVSRRLGYGAAHAEAICEEVARTIAMVECEKLSSALQGHNEPKPGLRARFERFVKSVADNKQSPIEESAMHRCQQILEKVAEASTNESEVPISHSVEESVKWLLRCLDLREKDAENARSRLATCSPALRPAVVEPVPAATEVRPLIPAAESHSVSAEEHHALKEQVSSELETLKQALEEAKKRDEEHAKEMKELRELLKRKADADERTKDKEQHVTVSGASQAQLQLRPEEAQRGTSSQPQEQFVSVADFEQFRHHVAESLVAYGEAIGNTKDKPST